MSNTFAKARKLVLKDLVEYSSNGIISKLVIESKAGNITLFSFDKEQRLSEHSAPFDAFVQILEGTAVIMIDGKQNELLAGDSIIMPANIPHAVYAKERFKMLLSMIKGN